MSHTSPEIDQAPELWECDHRGCPVEFKPKDAVFDQTGDYVFCSEKCHAHWLADQVDAAEAQVEARMDDAQMEKAEKEGKL